MRNKIGVFWEVFSGKIIGDHRETSNSGNYPDFGCKIVCHSRYSGDFFLNLDSMVFLANLKLLVVVSERATVFILVSTRCRWEYLL